MNIILSCSIFIEFLFIIVSNFSLVHILYNEMLMCNTQINNFINKKKDDFTNKNTLWNIFQ